MNVRERLKEAYENVSFSADRTWTNAPNAYHKSNMELHLRENHIQRKKLHGNRPRTVRECIPKSKLAQYANYVYNESREMSYAPSTSIGETNFSSRSPSEPWEMPEVGELYRWFLKNQLEDNFSRLERRYESPLLNVTGFEDKILKIQITEDRVKNVWSKDSYQFGDHRNRTNQIVINFFTSPMKNIFFFNNESDHNHEWFRSISISRDFEQLEQLSMSLRKQVNSISKFLGGGNEIIPPAEPTSSEILYSEVLQGLSPSRKLLSSFKSDHGRVLTEEPSVSHDSFTNYTILNSQRAGQEDPNKSDNPSQSNFPKVSQFSTVPSQSSNKYVPQKNATANVYFQTDTQSYARYKNPNNQFPVDSVPRHARTSMIHPFSSSYVQQTYFYSPVQTIQRWIPSYYPTQIFTSSWFTQNPVGRILGTSPVNVPSETRDPSKSCEGGRVEDNQETVEMEPFVEDHQVSASISEELEIQALEQYSNSNENFYQELERQAAEQYASSPE